MAKKILLGVAVLAVLAFFAFQAMDVDGISNVKVHTSCSPDKMYEGPGPYCLSVVESKHAFDKKCKIGLEDKLNSSPYGNHYIYTMDVADGACDKVKSVDWDKDGVVVTFENSMTAIPINKFTGEE